MTTPTFDELMAAWSDLQAALSTLRDARVAATMKAGVFDDVLAAYLDRPHGWTADQVDAVKVAITDHLAVLKGQAGSSPQTPTPSTGDRTMPTLPPDIQALWDQVGTQTTAVGARIAVLNGQIVAGMTDAAAADLRAKFQGEIDVLTGYAADPNNPPPPGPPPAPVTAKKKP